MDLRREVEGIRAKMLSRELKELEINGLVIRTVCNTKPITVEYTLSDYGRTLEPLIKNIAEWGQRHREVILNQ